MVSLLTCDRAPKAIPGHPSRRADRSLAVLRRRRLALLHSGLLSGGDGAELRGFVDREFGP
jgi:hypothetical protein